MSSPITVEGDKVTFVDGTYATMRYWLTDAGATPFMTFDQFAADDSPISSEPAPEGGEETDSATFDALVAASRGGGK